MSNLTCGQLLEVLANQLQRGFTVVDLQDQCVVATPLMYPDNTRITVALVQVDNTRVLVTDSGEASDYAFVNGAGEPAIRDRVRKTVARFGLVETGAGELALEVPISSLSTGIFQLAMAIQDVAYLVYHRPSARSQRNFKESVESFLTLSGKSFSKDVTLPGRTGRKMFDHAVSAEGARELLLSVFESTSPKAALKRAKEIAFDYEDIQAALEHAQVPQLIVLFDNTNHRVENAFSDEVASILASHVSKVIPWTNRHELETLLDAA